MGAESLEEIVALDADDGARADAQQAFHALAFPARYGTLAIKRLTAAFGSLGDLGFAHLKRLKKLDGARGQLIALVVPVVSESGDDSASPRLTKELREALQRDFDGTWSEVEVLRYGPKTREDWTRHTVAWPLIFHASVVPETLAEPITEEEAAQMETLVRCAVERGQRFRTENPEPFCCSMGCVIADPAGATDSAGYASYALVADSQTTCVGDDRQYAFRSLFHPVMVAIDGVATRDRARDGASGGGGRSRKHRRTESSTAQEEKTTREVEEDEIGKNTSYLCTGYDVFVDVEPCVMCAMALVHSRARRVVFAARNETDGALASVHRLHTIKSLNHRYRVFHLPL